MAKKKKKKKSNSSKRARQEKNSFSSDLAAQLKKIDVSVKPSEEQDEATSARDTERATPPPSPARELSDEELFMKAMEHIPAATPAKKRKGSSPFSNAFRKDLRDFDISSTPPRHEPRDEARGGHHEQSDSGAQAPADASAKEPTRTSPLTEEELFLHAVEGIDPTDVYAGKYQGHVGDLPPSEDSLEVGAPTPRGRPRAGDEEAIDLATSLEPIDEEEARAKIATLREDMLFERFVGKLDAIQEQRKYYRQKPNASRTEKANTRDDEEHDYQGFIAPPLPSEGPGLHLVEELDTAHKGILTRCKLWSRSHDLLSLNLRGDSIEDARRQLELFIHQAWKDNTRYVRVIHGRGLQSEAGVPVIKPAVLEWMSGEGFRYVRGYAPELTLDNDYGSLIVCLTKRGEKKER